MAEAALLNFGMGGDARHDDARETFGGQIPWAKHRATALPDDRGEDDAEDRCEKDRRGRE